MPSTVAELFAAAGIELAGVVGWGTPPALTGPGVYAVSRSAQPLDLVAAEPCPVDPARIEELLAARPELTLDGRHPSNYQLAGRLAAMWLPSEPVVYVGLAGTSVAKRVADYYRTPLGARSPHAGGWPIKILATLGDLFVHYGPAADPDEAESAMAGAFLDAVDAQEARSTPDPVLSLPFANLRFPGGRNRKHGISGAREPRVAGTVSDASESSQDQPVAAAVLSDRPGTFVLTVTESDLRSGQVRVTREPKRRLEFPSEKASVAVTLRGRRLDCAWDPRDGPDKERSGLLRIGKAAATELVRTPGTLRISRSSDGWTLQ